MKKTILLIALAFFALPAFSLEKDYQNAWCGVIEKGETEFTLPDKTRVDCLTDTHAIEFDFGKNWYAAIGQSLWYASNTGRRAGVVLIVGPKEDRFVKRLKATINHYGLPIDVWIMKK